MSVALITISINYEDSRVCQISGKSEQYKNFLNQPIPKTKFKQTNINRRPS